MWAVARPPRLHPEAVAFAEQYGFAIWLAAAYRPQSKGRVERQVEVVRSHVLDGRTFDSLTAMDAAFAAWLPVRRAAVHRTHGEVTRVRAEPDRAALGPLPEHPYVVCDRHTRRVGKDALVSFAASPPRCPGGRCDPAAGWNRWVTPAEVAIWSLGRQPRLLAVHTPGLPDEAPGWSTRRTGTACPTGPMPNRSRPAPPTASSPRHPHSSPASYSCPASQAGSRPLPPAPRSPAGALPSTTSSRGWDRERAGRHPDPRARRAAPPGLARRQPRRPGHPGW